MWTCPKCGRIFEKTRQSHSCHIVPLGQHFQHKDQARELYDRLLDKVNEQIGRCRVISLPCCIHLFGRYDFLAVLPKKDKIEIRFASDQKLKNPRVKQSIPTSAELYKICLDIEKKEEMNAELLRWLRRAYFLKDKKN